MEELRPLLGIAGLLVVAVGLGFWIARQRGRRFEWWERLFSPGRRRGTPRAAGERGAARSARGAEKGAGGARSPSTLRSRPTEGGGADRAAPELSETRSGRQTLIDLDFLPLLDPDDAVSGTALDREYDVGDLGSVETGTGEESRPVRAPAADSASPAGGKTGREPGSTPGRGRRPESKPLRRRGGNGHEAGAAAEARAPPAETRELIIVLTIITPGERDLAGPVIREALAAFSLQPDDHGLFHHYGNRRASTREPVFSVANVLEPGEFDLTAMDELTTPGLCLFLCRPGPLPATVAFDLMLDVASRLARALGAVLCDDQRCRLTVQATQALRERVAHFALRHERSAPNAG